MNCRPVSPNSIYYNLAEHIVVSQTMDHQDKYYILDDLQHGFRRRRSCETQLLITSHYFASLLSKHSQTDKAILDFSRAFVRVPHHRLIQELQYYNLDSSIIIWIEAFFDAHALPSVTSLHHQHQVVDNLHLHHGISQGHWNALIAAHTSG